MCGGWFDPPKIANKKKAVQFATRKNCIAICNTKKLHCNLQHQKIALQFATPKNALLRNYYIFPWLGAKTI